MDAFELSDLIAERERWNKPYLEFLRVPSLSAGLYVLPVGAEDKQTPHTEDEIYYVVSGQGMMRVGNEDCSVQAGSFVYVEAGGEHRFHSITETLTLLVVFAPAEYTQA
jgi:mannose-6-phosphate isomerase-like protein (cupin superfamily)